MWKMLTQTDDENTLEIFFFFFWVHVITLVVHWHGHLAKKILCVEEHSGRYLMIWAPTRTDSRNRYVQCRPNKQMHGVWSLFVFKNHGIVSYLLFIDSGTGKLDWRRRDGEGYQEGLGSQNRQWKHHHP